MPKQEDVRPYELTEEEMDTIEALRQGRARVVSVSDRERAKAASMARHPAGKAPLRLDELERGKMYLIVSQDPTQRRPRVSAMRYLDGTPAELTFDARPTAGTQTMPVGWVVKIEPTAETVPFVGNVFR